MICSVIGQQIAMQNRKSGNLEPFQTGPSKLPYTKDNLSCRAIAWGRARDEKHKHRLPYARNVCAGAMPEECLSLASTKPGAEEVGGENYSLKSLLRPKVGLDVRHALSGDCIDWMQWNNAILLVKDLHFIEIR